jgi:hypothetical protein
MRHHWIRDRVKAGQFVVNWEPGTSNKADFFTKALSSKDYQRLRSAYIFDSPTPSQNLTRNKKARTSC